MEYDRMHGYDPEKHDYAKYALVEYDDDDLPTKTEIHHTSDAISRGYYGYHSGGPTQIWHRMDEYVIGFGTIYYDDEEEYDDEEGWVAEVEGEAPRKFSTEKAAKEWLKENIYCYDDEEEDEDEEEE